MGRRHYDLALEIASFPLLVICWQVLAMILANRLFPTPVTVAADLWAQLTHGKLLSDMSKTMSRVVISFSVAMTVGTALGIALGRIRWLDRLFSPWLVVGMNLPAVVVAIVLYIWLGLTERALLLAVIANKVPLVTVTIREGVRSFSSDFDELAVAYRLPLGSRLRQIALPQLMPFLFAAARTGLSLIWKIVLVFELLGSDGGVGFRISIFFQLFDTGDILAYSVAFVLVVLAIEYLLLRPIEHRVMRWRPALQ